MKYLLFISFFITVSCSEKKVEDHSFYGKDEGAEVLSDETDLLTYKENRKSSLSMKIQDIRYSISTINGLDYIQRTGNKIADNDKSLLEKESVLMLEFLSENSLKNIFESENLQFGKDDAIKYLIGDILNDLTINQSGKEIKPHSLNYEGQIGAMNLLRVTFYTQGLDLSSPFQIEYYDRFFGKGIIKFKSNKNTLISTL